MKKRKLIVVACLMVLILFVIWVLWGNTALELTTYKISSANLPDAFVGYRIAHISDLHNDEFGEENEELLVMLGEAKPDIIVVTGDLVDSSEPNIEIGIQFAENIVKIAPTYYVTGNHEARLSSEEYDKLKAGLELAGVVLLDHERMELEKSGEKIVLMGVSDPNFYPDYVYLGADSAAVVENDLQELTNEVDGFTILLSHRPELFEIYEEYDMDLVFCGHAHGGQFRLPFVGGLIAPNQGLFPKYDAGIYAENETTMVVSRGIGNSVIPLRFNNRPEVILVELEGE